MSSVLSMPVLVALLIWSDFSNAHNERGKLLSRKRRYLLFPEGSSLQLVYDFTVPISYSKTIFVFSTTAALAWMLPSTIEEFQNGFFSKKFHKLPSNRIDTQKTQFTKLKPVYNTEFGHNRPYEKYTSQYNDKYTTYQGYRNNLVRYRPNYVRFNTNYNDWKHHRTIEKSPAYLQSMRRKYYVLNNNRKNQNYYRPVTTYVDPVHIQYHRRTSRDLFKKIEKFLTAQKKDGRSCILKAICEVNEQSAQTKGTFTEEIFKAIFRFSPSHNGETDIYDNAVKSPPKCAELHPCDFSIWEVI